LSNLVDFEDLSLLDGVDLRAVLGQVEPDQVVVALVGVPTGLRQRLLGKLSSSSATRLAAQVQARGPVTTEAARKAQRALVEALCRLSRAGQVAFDDPADMVA
jgi:flagellar motor switch protein FliG